MSGFSVTTFNPPAIGILSARRDSLAESFLSSNLDVTLGVNSERYQSFLLPCQNIDGFALADLDTINDKLVSIGNSGEGSVWYSAPLSFATPAAAEAAVEADYTGIVTNVGVATALRFPSSHNFTEGEYVTQTVSGAFGRIIVSANSTFALLTGVGGTSSFNTVAACRVGTSTDYNLNVTNIGVPNQIQYAGFGDIVGDSISLVTYPNLEPININVSNPYFGETVVNLGVGNTGLGIGNTLSLNGGSFIGTVFAFNTSVAVAAATSITNITNEITGPGGLRTGVVSFTDSVNVIKPIKIDFQVNAWSLSRVDNTDKITIAGLGTAISILNDPAFGGPY